MTWSDTFLGVLKDNDVRLVSYVPDNVLTPLLKGVTTDNYFLSVGATREDEAIGTVTGAYMAGLRGAVMMQTSGFALLANALASLVMPYKIPAIMVISERGTLGEFNIGQALVARTMRPSLIRSASCITRWTTKPRCGSSSTVRSSRPSPRRRRSPSSCRRLLTGGNPAALPS
jgi:sulfopyruvate decarboxylase TPP-binding subunit